MADVVMQAQDLKRHYRAGGGLMAPAATVRALDGVSFSLEAGHTLAVVGESGCGKSTLARQLTLIEPPTAGALRIDGVDVATLGSSGAVTKALRRRVQMVFQNPYASLNPRKTVAAALAEPLVIHHPELSRAQRSDRVLAMIERVGLRAEHAGRYPHMFSGGQRQRIGIARAMMLGPGIVVADEPTSALDVSIQAQILNLFMDLQRDTGTAYVFISHNLSVVRHVAHAVMVMYFGRAVEQGPRSAVLDTPQHPYTRALLAAVPALDPAERIEHVPLQGEIPSPLAPPSGCAFHTRCPLVEPRCRVEVPLLRQVAGRQVACHVVAG
ncbi:MAG: dipeptide ABC transporter ATP-binding protein [Pseudomonadota bacterium]|nr:dipeptide ABC transporter ATP-binding protein [Pseudomonadota bacterium]